MKTLRVALVGDYSPDITAHQAIPVALQLAAEASGHDIQSHWLTTDEIDHPALFNDFHGIWCVPGSPYRSEAGALLAIRTAREQHIPFLGSCGGFQHALLEYARHVLGWAEATHAEIDPDSPHAVISRLSCSLIDVKAGIMLSENSQLARLYGRTRIEEGFRCNYGPSPRLTAHLQQGPLRAVGHDDAGEVRAIELQGHPYFIASLFQPERSALQGILPPPVAGLVHAMQQR
ncbi:CTP synthase [Leeia sp.]|uniref:CTP synthase C-terminal region-related (seleno)protein n=1 Tax=Leeia sp. TaxID=2884678 RepID=UPI0035B1BF29